MSDRELLELAAKAAGLKNCKYMPLSRDSGIMMVTDEKLASMPWNPLIDDGDALLLAVACEISFGITRQADYLRVAWWMGAELHSQDAPKPSKMQAHDIAEWLRRAIVRAAAEIGRALP